jgi:hypothetical protein
MFIVVAEGTVTEQEYFAMFDDHSIVRVRCLTNLTNLSPNKALKKALSFIAEEGLRSSDEIWIVVDRDSWEEADLQAIHIWSTRKPNHGFALSNPRFESWLLLHFEDARGRALSIDCDAKLKGHHPGYDKHINAKLFTTERVKSAISRAKKHDSPRCEDWPRKAGSTVYRLVEKLVSYNPSN